MVNRRGITLIELIVIIGLSAAIVAVLLPMLSRTRSGGGMKVKDAANLRSIAQSFNAWAPDNKDKYPTPSIVDRNNDVLSAADPGEKNTSGAVMSLLIFANSMTPEVAVSPLETGHVQIMAAYEYTIPSGAINPAAALWDPKFKGTPKDQVPGPSTTVAHLSYAHAPIASLRAVDIGALSATTPLLSGRGPLYEPDPRKPGAYRVSPDDAARGVDSPAYVMHKNKNAWRGNVAFQDAHVESRSAVLDDGDHLFVRENPKPDGTPQDAFMREYWRGVPFDVPFELISGGTVVGTPDDPYAEPDGPRVYVDGDK